MRPTVSLFFVQVALMVFVCSGCLSVANSPIPKFYTLHSTQGPEGFRKFDIAAKLIIGVGPVEIPEYQNRPQMVTRDKDGLLTFAQFERWGEPLDSGLERLILENLTAMLPQAEFQIFPCNFAIPLDYQVIVSVRQLESQLDKEMLFSGQWTIIDSRTKEMLLTKRFQVHQEIVPHTYSGLAQAMSRVATLLSDQIAENLAGLSNASKAKDAPGQ